MLSAPIFDHHGRPVGVMQALNKKQGIPGKATTTTTTAPAPTPAGPVASLEHFTKRDEKLLCEFCHQILDLMAGADCLRDCSDASHSTLVSTFVNAVMGADSLPMLADVVREQALGAVDCDHVGLYSFMTEGVEGLGGLLEGLGEEQTAAFLEDTEGGYLLCQNDLLRSSFIRNVGDSDTAPPSGASVPLGGQNNAQTASLPLPIPMRSLPTCLIDALRTETNTEYSVNSGVADTGPFTRANLVMNNNHATSPHTTGNKGQGTTQEATDERKGETICENFLPGINARHVLIYPLKRPMLVSPQPIIPAGGRDSLTGGSIAASPRLPFRRPVLSASTVLVVARSDKSTLLPFSGPARQILELLASVMTASIDHITARQLQDLSYQSSLEANIHVVNTLLATLEDYIVMLDAEGFLVAWNRDLVSLVGGDSMMELEGASPTGESKNNNSDEQFTTAAAASSSSSSSSSSHRGTTAAGAGGGGGSSQRQHIFHFLKESHCLSLRQGTIHHPPSLRPDPLYLFKSFIYDRSITHTLLHYPFTHTRLADHSPTRD